MEREYLGYKKYVWFMGVVEDINDPLSLSRVRVRILSLHTEDSGVLPTADLHWATVSMPTTSAGVSGIGFSPNGLVQGSWVWGFFLDGEDAQQAMVCGTWHGIHETSAVTNKGFNDPSGEFPRYTNEPDTNKLARGENTIEDVVDDKIGNPASPYAAVYPNNKVIETTSGHIVELDDTEGAERIRLYHKSGSFVEMHPNGDVVQSHKNRWQITTGNDSARVTGDVNIFVDGNANLTCPSTNITGDVNIEGNLNISGESKASDHLSGGISGKTHTHIDTPGLGAGKTTPPQ